LPYDDSFLWNCLGYDAAGNYNWSGDGNYTVTLDRITPVISLVSPANNTITGVAAQTFTCNITDNYWVANLTLFVWNSTGNSIYNSTAEISGAYVENDFEYTLPYDGGFNWNCLGYDALGNNNWSNVGNYTINLTAGFISIDIVSPTPKNNTNTTNTSFVINISIWNATDLDTFVWMWDGDNYTIYNGSLLLMYNLDNVSNLGESYNNSNGTIIVDLSSYGNNGTLYVGDDNSGVYTDGRYEGAYSFDGVDDYIDSGNDSSLNSNSSISVEVWVKADSITGGERHILDKIEGSGGYQLRIEDGDLIFLLKNSSGGILNVSKAGALTTNWHHVVGTWNGTNQTLYVDGSWAAASNGIVDDFSSTIDLVIGHSVNKSNQDYTWNGTIDEVRIWDRVLSAAEVTQHYYSNLKKYDTDKWYFLINETVDEPDGHRVYNYSGHAVDTLGNENTTEMWIINISGSGPSLEEGGDGNGTGGCGYTYSPSNKSIFNTSTITFGWTICDDDNLTCNLIIDGVVNKSNLVVPGSVAYSTSVSGFDGGGHPWSISCWDPSNNTANSLTHPLFVDVIYPNITFTEPTLLNNSVINISWTYVNVSADDTTSNISAFIDFDDSLVSWWRFDEVSGSTVEDYMQRYDGTAYGSAAQTRVGYHGQAYSFDGDGDYINVTGINSSSTNSTISAWVKMAVSGTDSYIIDIENGRITLGIHGDNNTLAYYDGVDWQNSTTNVADDEWHHVVAVTDNSTSNVTLYVDGNSVLSAAVRTNSIGGSATIGAGYLNESYLKGKIDDVMIFNRTLSADEIAGLYSNQTTKYLEWNFTGLKEGWHTFKAYAQDYGGNVNFTKMRMIFVDTIYPIISFTDPTPANSTKTNDTSIEINVSITETNLVELKWSWNDTNTTIYNESLVLMYNFDNVSALGESYNNSNGTTVLDLSRYGNDGTLYVGDDNSGNYTSGRYGKAYSFDGVDDYVDAGSDSSLNFNGSITIMVWIKTNTISGGERHIIDKRGSLGGYQLRIENDDLHFLFKNSSGATLSLVETGVITTNWHHVVGTWNGSTQILYLDGSLITTATPIIDDFSDTQDLIIGHYSDKTDHGYTWNGTIDEVRIWNTSLSAFEVKQHYYSNLKKYDTDKWYFLINESVDEPYINISYNYSAYVVDVADNKNNTETREITIMGVPPEMTLYSPVNNSRFNVSSIMFNWTATDNISINVTCNLTIDNVVNQSNINVTRGTAYNVTVANISDGKHYWNVTCWDPIGNVNVSSAYNFLIDTVYPNISFADPTLANASTTRYDWLYVNVSSADSNNISTFVDLDNSLIAWYRFGEDSLINGSTLYDSSSYGNNGTVYANDSSGGARDISTSAGYFGSGGEFDGEGDLVDVGNNTFDSLYNGGSGKISIGFWIKTSEDRSNPSIMPLSIESVWFFRVHRQSNNKISVTFTGNSVDLINSTTNITDNLWHHVVGIYNGTAALLYVDGNLEDNATQTLFDITSVNRASGIGASPYTSEKYFNGSMDDVIIFNRSLSEEEIRGLYANQSSRYLVNNFTGLADGNHTFEAYSQDLGGNVNSTETRRVIVDTTPPIIVLSAPVNNSRFNISSIMFNWTAKDNISINVTCNLTIDNVVNQSNLSVTRDSAYNLTIANLSDKTHYWDVTCWDSVNNTQNSETYWLLIDTVYPGIEFTSDISANNSMQNYTHIFVNASGSDGNNISMFIDFGDSLVSWWRFDEFSGSTVEDYMERNDGTSYGDAEQTDAGYFGKGFDFDGDGDYVDVADDAELRLTNWTISAWIYPLDVSGRHLIIGKGIHSSSPYRNYEIETNGAVLNALFENSTGNDSTLLQGGTISTNTWYHIAYTKNSSTHEIYVDGISVDSDSVSIIPDTSSGSNLIIGKYDAGSINPFNGTIDDVMIFNRSLSASEVSALYANTSSRYISSNFTDLVDGWYTFKSYVQDVGGNVNSTEERQVKVDTTPPEVTATTPSDTVYVSNVNINITTNENATCRYIPSTEGNMTTPYENMTYNFTDSNIYHNATVTLANDYYEFYARCKDVVENIMNESANISFTVDVVTTTVTAPTTGGGGGAAIPKNVSKNVLLEVRGLLDKTLISGDEIEFTIMLENKGELKLNDISLDTETDAPDMDISLSKAFFEGLDVGEKDQLLLKIKSLIDPKARIGKQRYAVVLNVNAGSPVYNTSKRFFIDLEEQGYQKRIESLQEIQFVEDLFREHPECLELNEVIKQAQEMYDNYEYQKAIELIDKAIAACKKLIALEDVEEVEKPAPKRNMEIILFIIEMVVLFILMVGMYYYYYKRKGGKKPERGVRTNLEVRFDDLFEETVKLIRSRDIEGARRNYMELHTVYNAVVASSLPAAIKSEYHKKLLILHSRLSGGVK